MIKDKCVNELGFEQVNIDNLGNIIATKGSGEPYILLCGHMDTVPGQVLVRIEDGYIHGRGASDAKSPLIDRKSTRLNSSHLVISYAVFCSKKKMTYPARQRLHSVLQRTRS